MLKTSSPLSEKWGVESSLRNGVSDSLTGELCLLPSYLFRLHLNLLSVYFRRGRYTLQSCFRKFLQHHFFISLAICTKLTKQMHKSLLQKRSEINPNLAETLREEDASEGNARLEIDFILFSGSLQLRLTQNYKRTREYGRSNINTSARQSVYFGHTVKYSKRKHKKGIHVFEFNARSQNTRCTLNVGHVGNRYVSVNVKVEDD